MVYPEVIAAGIVAVSPQRAIASEDYERIARCLQPPKKKATKKRVNQMND